MITAQGLARRNPDAWLEDVCERTYAALAERGTATATQVTRDVPELALKLAFGEGTRWAATVGLSTRVLFLLATDGRIIRARPAGTWISGQYRWATVESWLGAPLQRLDPRPARASLVGKWLRAFGPGTTADIRWWGRWTAAETRAALDDVRAVEVTVGDATPAWVLPDDVDPQRGVAQGVAMLPGLDPTVMGWKDRSWYLGDHAAALFDRNGNAGPTIWSDGRVVGGWAMTGPGVVAFRVLEDVGREVTMAIEAEADALTTWLGDVRVTPRFRTPLERDLAG
jgi:hypothetical protein